MKIVVATSAHWWDDPRIFSKYVKSFEEIGWDVTYVSTHTAQEERDLPKHVGATKLIHLKRPSGRLARLALAAPMVALRALTTPTDYYQLHDPELIPFIPLLRLRAPVIFDAHEDLPQQVMAKPYLPPRIRPIIAAASRGIFSFAGLTANYVTAASPRVANRFPSGKTVVVRNYARLSGAFSRGGETVDADILIYTGALSVARGAVTMIEAMRDPRINGFTLELYGPIQGQEVQDAIDDAPDNVHYRGHVPPDRIPELLCKSAAGLAILQHTPAHLEGLPTKLYEYMAYGLPYVASDFPLWRNFTESSQAGVCVNPVDTNAIVEGIIEVTGPCRTLYSDRAHAYAASHLSWDSEFSNLLKRIGRSPS